MKEFDSVKNANVNEIAKLLAESEWCPSDIGLIDGEGCGCDYCRTCWDNALKDILK